MPAVVCVLVFPRLSTQRAIALLGIATTLRPVLRGFEVLKFKCVLLTKVVTPAAVGQRERVLGRATQTRSHGCRSSGEAVQHGC